MKTQIFTFVVTAILVSSITLAFHQPTLIAETVSTKTPHKPKVDLSSWDYYEPVRYLENHDPSQIYLDQDRQIEVRYNPIPWKEVESWKRGKLLYIVYKPQSGAVLLDPATMKHIPIIIGLKQHPIDSIQAQLIEKDGSTIGMAKAISQATKLWDLELNRVYQNLLKTKGDYGQMPKKDVETLREAQRKWVQFRDAQIKAIGAYYRQFDGTIRIIVVGGSTTANNRPFRLNKMDYPKALEKNWKTALNSCRSRFSMREVTPILPPRV